MGGANSVLALLDKGIGLGVQSQEDLVPVQRQILEMGIAKQNEEAQPDSGSGGRMKNSRANEGNVGAGGKRKETVKYVNESEKDR